MKKPRNYIPILLVLICTILTAYTAHSQLTFEQDKSLEVNISGKSQKSYQSKELSGFLKEYEIIQIDNLSEIKKSLGNPSSRYNVTLVLGSIFSSDIELHHNTLLSEKYELDDNKGKQYKKSNARALAMTGLLPKAQEEVSLTINDDFIYGYINDKGNTYFIEPLYYFEKSASRNLFVVYENKNVITTASQICGAIEIKEKGQQIREESKQEKMLGGCYNLELAIASDEAMFDAYGSVTDVENHNIGVMNNVQNNYDDEFNENIQFQIVKQVVITNGSDPWGASSNSSTLLSNFANWASSGGFAINHDLGQLWTNINISGGVVGIAYLISEGNGVVCNTNFKYHVLEDFSPTASQLRVLTAHEMGHNFGAQHDSEGGYIMTGSVNNTSSWSSKSLTAINGYLSNLVNTSCFTSCGPVTGCTDSNAHNYNPNAVTDDGSCETCNDGIKNGDELSVDCGGSKCAPCPADGCTDPNAHNYNPNATSDDGSCETCTDGIQNGDETAVDCGGSLCDPCPCFENAIALSITFDNFPNETTFSITNSAGNTIISGGPYDQQTYAGSTGTADLCLADDCYTFTINDSYGDGICCGVGQGAFSIVDGSGNTLVSGSQFTSSYNADFCFNSGPPPSPTCEDGIQNGDETGIDCGGATCNPCPCDNNVTISGNIQVDKSFNSMDIIATDLINPPVVMNNATLNLSAANSVLLNQGFEVNDGSQLIISIENCQQTAQEPGNN